MKDYQWIAFMALCAPPAERWASFMFSIALNADMGHYAVMANRISGAAFYTLWIGVLYVLSTWPDELDPDQISRLLAKLTREELQRVLERWQQDQRS
jgi:hypothetical protein